MSCRQFGLQQCPKLVSPGTTRIAGRPGEVVDVQVPVRYEPTAQLLTQALHAVCPVLVLSLSARPAVETATAPKFPSVGLVPAAVAGVAVLAPPQCALVGVAMVTALHQDPASVQ